MFKFNKFKFACMAIAGGMLTSLAASCGSDNDDNNNNNGRKEVTPSEVKFIVTADDVTKDLRGGAYMQVFTNIEDASRRDVSIYGEKEGTVFSPDGFTQVNYNHNTNVFTGHIYAKGASQQGGIGQAGKRTNGLRTYTFNGNTLTGGTPFVLDGFGNTGVYGNYTYAANGGEPKVVRVKADGQGEVINIDFSKYQINGSNPQISGIVDLGNNQVAMAVDYADRDSFAVAFADYDLKVSKVIFSTKAGHSKAGRKAARYSQLVKDAEGNLYAFGGTATHDEKCVAVKINKGTQEFDESYVLDVNKLTGGYRVRKVFFISGDKFLVELFAEKGKSENMGETGKFLVANMGAKTLTEVTGLPEKIAGAYIGWGDSYNGKFYLPVSAGTGLLRNAEKNLTPTVYVIDPATAKASVFMTLKQSNIIKGFTIATK